MNAHLHRWVSHTRSVHGDNDRIFRGYAFLKKLLKANTIVRRGNYEKRCAFPLDMPWAGDWYLWCLFSLYSDVGYLAEPMVAYREHEQSMTSKLWRENVAACCEEDVKIPWAIRVKPLRLVSGTWKEVA